MKKENYITHKEFKKKLFKRPGVRKARKDLEVPDEYSVEAMVVIGKRAPKENLSPDLQAREVPSQRKALKELVMEGRFRK